MTKLNKLITNWPSGLVYTSAWLKEHGYSPALVAQYRKSNWLSALGNGAYIKKGDKVSWQGAVAALQNQSNLNIHIGARTALQMHGISHYVREKEAVFLFGEANTRLPVWFKSQEWKPEVSFFRTKLFTSNLGIGRKALGDFSVSLSLRERALFEQLHLVPHAASFSESMHLFEGLYTLRHDVIQKLLEECSSVKVKRLFMVIAEEFNYPWVRKIDLRKVDFGHGSRSIGQGGKMNSKYKITVGDMSLRIDSF